MAILQRTDYSVVLRVFGQDQYLFVGARLWFHKLHVQERDRSCMLTTQPANDIDHRAPSLRIFWNANPILSIFPSRDRINSLRLNIELGPTLG